MSVVVARERNQAVFIGAESVCKGRVNFMLDRGRKLRFESATPAGLLTFGVRIRCRGTVQLSRGFEVQDAEVQMVPSSLKSDPRLVPFFEGDRDTALSTAVKKAVMTAARKVLEREVVTLAEAWLDLADDVAVEQMSYRDHCAEKRAQTDDWKEQSFYDDQIMSTDRAMHDLDEETYAHSWLFSSRPGYVVVCDGKPADRGDRRFKEDYGQGWIQRHVCIHLAEAHRFAQELGRDGAEVRVERLRVIDGSPYVVVPGGIREPEWSLSEPVLTGTVLAR